MIAFALAGALTAIGGILLAPTVPMAYSSGLTITINGFAAAVFGGLVSIRLALLGGYALGIVEQLVVGYIDPQYNLIIALIVMLVLIGWRSRVSWRYERDPGASASQETHGDRAVRRHRRRDRRRVLAPVPARLARTSVCTTAWGCTRSSPSG